MKYSDWFKKISEGTINVSKNSCGLCHNFSVEFDCDLIVVMAKNNITFETWPEFSGYKVYPVPDLCRHKQVAYYIYATTYNQFNKRTKYGKARLRLALWLSEQFSAIGE